MCGTKRTHSMRGYKRKSYKKSYRRTWKGLKKGTKIEMEHTKSKRFASKIARDHLKENKNYYKYVKKGGKEYLVTKHKGKWSNDDD